MFDFLRNWRKTAVQRQQEMLHAYVDEALSPDERRQFEEMLAADEGLQAELAQMQQMKTQFRQLPRRRVPRNFTLDPAVYGRPQRQPLFQLYPAMRTAMVLTAFFFIFAIAADLFTGVSQQEAAAPAADIAFLAEESAEAVEVEVTRVVIETMVEGETVALEAEETVVEIVVEEPEEEDVAEEAAEMEALPVPLEEDAPAGESADGDMADAAAASGEAATKTAVPPDVGAASAPASTAPPPTPTPLATLTANLAATEPADGSPRVTDDDETAADRAAPELTDAQTTEEPAAEPETAVTTQPPLATREPANPWRIAQIGLGLLLVALGTAVWYVRRHS